MIPPPPSTDEFRQRQLAVAEGARALGLDGVLVWSSCGSALDAFGSAFYLTNHYSPVPRVNMDIEPFMTGWGQTAVIVTADGEVTLVSENGDIRTDLIVTGRLAHSRDLYGEAVRALRAAGLGEARIGLAGASCLPLAAWQRIEAELPGLQTTNVDELLYTLRMRKSPAEIELMRHASVIGCDIQNAMLPLARPGARDLDLAVEGMRVCMEAGAVLWDFAFASGPASGHGYWCRLPPWDRERRYEPGDIVHPDAYGAYDGYFFDIQRTVVVGGDPSPRLRWLLEGVVGVVEAVCAACRPGVQAADVARIKDTWLADYGYQDQPSAAASYEADLMEKLSGVGHGMGLGFELPWIDTASPWALEAGMTIALEVYLSEPGVGTVAFEHVVLVTDGEPEILTLGCPSRWW
jgi:Xaa-Pro aminopeptidase